MSAILVTILMTWASASALALIGAAVCLVDRMRAS